MNQDSQDRVKALANRGDTAEAVNLLTNLLNDAPDDADALIRLGILLIKEDRHGLAYNVLARACKLAPDNPDAWLNFGRAHKDIPDQWGKTEWCLRKGLKLYAAQNKVDVTAWSNLAMLQYIKGDLEAAQKAIDLALDHDSENTNALATQGYIHLARGNWAKAWRLYDVMLAKGKREQYAYGDEPEWDGRKIDSLIISGEQGIGDEIMYASVFNDVLKDIPEVVIDCMPRLQKLFQRSFPQATVYGTRWDHEVFWVRDHAPQAHVAMASVPRFYRLEDEDFPGTPYLVPNPDIKQAVNGLLSTLGENPKVGIAWTGGTERTRGNLRTRTLEELLPILRIPGVDWVSLEYENREEEINEFEEKRKISVHSFPWLTGKGLDYDYTAALVSELDLIISVPTTVTQMAGAVGIECWVLVPKYTGWIFARDEYLWADSVSPLKNTSIKEVAEKLEQWLSARFQTLKLLSQTG